MSRDLLSGDHCIVVQFPSIRSVTILDLRVVLFKFYVLNFTHHFLYEPSSESLFKGPLIWAQQQIVACALIRRFECCLRWGHPEAPPLFTLRDSL